MPIVTVGIDLAKNIFAIHGVDDAGKAVLIKPRVSRDQLVTMIAQLLPCRIGMEACSGAHHWARLFSSTAIPSSSWHPSSSRLIGCPASAARTMRRMRPQSARRSLVPTCVSYRLSAGGVIEPIRGRCNRAT